MVHSQEVSTSARISLSPYKIVVCTHRGADESLWILWACICSSEPSVCLRSGRTSKRNGMRGGKQYGWRIFKYLKFESRKENLVAVWPFQRSTKGKQGTVFRDSHDLIMIHPRVSDLPYSQAMVHGSNPHRCYNLSTPSNDMALLDYSPSLLLLSRSRLEIIHLSQSKHKNC